MSATRLLQYLVEVASKEAPGEVDVRPTDSVNTTINVTQACTALGLTAPAIRRICHQLQLSGLPIHLANSSAQLQFAKLPPVLNSVEITKALAPMRVMVHSQLDSTNSHALMTLKSEVQAPLLDDGLLVTCESQQAGRGTRGRRWVAPPWRNLFFSVGRRLTTHPAQLAGLSLAVGVLVAQTVRRLSSAPVCLKWPNDVLVEDHKLAGILIETASVSQDVIGVVIGVGLNVDLSGHSGAGAQTFPAIDLQQLCGEVDRQQLLIQLVVQLNTLLKNFVHQGFDKWQHAYQQLDALAGRDVSIDVGGEILCGRVLGVNRAGYLQLNDGIEVRSIASGSITKWRND